jgi:DNA-binding CsgD family transcriptional regulator/tetratricopeptide (TPR) repeat protein
MFVGRDAELTRVVSLVSAGRGGGGGSLVISGEAGIGKSALLEAAGRHATEFTILRMTGIESESSLAYGGLVQLLRPLLSRLPELPAAFQRELSRAMRPSRSRVDPLTVAAAVASLISLAAEETGVVVLIDDMQWVDPPSARAVAFVARRLREAAVVVLLAVRDGESLPVALDGLEQERLRPLALRDATEILRRLGVPEGEHGPVLRTAGGNPLALIELARDPGKLPIQAPTVGERLFGTRLDKLDAAAAQTLLVAALETSGEASIIAAASPDVDSVKRLCDHGLVDIRAGVLHLRHPLLRSLVLERAWSDRRRRAHAALAAVLPDGPDRVRHRALATVEPDEDVAAELESLGATSAESGERAWAVERAAELTPAGRDQSRREVLAARAALDSGNVPAARKFIAAVQLGKDPAARLDANELEARLQIAAGELVAGAYTLKDLATMVEEPDPVRAARLLVDAATALTTASRTSEALSLIQRAHRVTPEHDHVLRLQVASAEADVGFMTGDFTRAQHLVREAAEAADREAAVHRDSAARLSLAEAMYGAGMNGRGREIATSVARSARREGALGTLRMALAVLFSVELRDGRVNAATAAANEELAIANQFGLLMELEEALGHVAWCDAMASRADDCVRHVRERYETGIELFADTVPHPSVGVLHLGLGQHERAIECLQQTLERQAARPTGVGSAAMPSPTQADLIEALVWAGRLPEARVSLATFEPRARLMRRSHDLSLVHRCRGLLADGGSLDAEFSQALAHDADEPYPLHRARSVLCWGARLRLMNRRADARKHLLAAYDEFSRLGATLWAERTRQELASVGHRVPIQALSSPLPTLTAKEEQVASLVIAGLSNRDISARLFISVNTVETHLRHLFEKLDVRSRTAMARKITENRDPEATIRL